MKSVKQGRWARKNPLVRHKNPKALKKLAIALAIVIAAATIYANFLQPHTLAAKQVRKLQATEHQLEQAQQQLLKSQKNGTQDQQRLQQLNQQLKQTQQQLSAKQAHDAAVAYAAALPTNYHSDNWYMEYIFQHESGGNPQAINPIGACGLGQSLPCSKLSMVCGWPATPACQVGWFTNYALERYGSWQNAYYYWINHGNW